ncbi:MAG: signal peptide peptidase SppA [Candidatus Melainabacteria bacterium]|nr:signal peptide peptidase SppA [Candidatus Melainabacteria bacterium]
MSTEKKNNWIVWLIIGLCVLAIPVGIFGKQSKKTETSDTTESGWGMAFKDRIKVINLSGMIMDSDEKSVFSMTDSTSSTIKKLRKAKDNPKIKAVLIRINSPGGTVATSQEINEAVTALKAEKPVYSSMGDIAASGGYYVACATDKIYANPGTLTGSIGVILNGMNFKGLADKLGVQPQVVKSGLFKDIASPYRPMTEEERKILQALIDDSYDQFVHAVSAGRKMPLEQVKKIADGRIYSGRQAKANGLVDELGSYQLALDGLQAACKEKYKLSADLPVDDKSTSSLFESLFESQQSSSLIPQMPQSTSMEANIARELLPVSMQARFRNQPLWLMQ